VLDRRLGFPTVLAMIVGTLLVLWALTSALGLGEGEDEAAAPTPTGSPTPCTPVADPYGPAPEGLSYTAVDEATRRRTVKALKLDGRSGRVDMRTATRDGATLGTLVAVPSKDPAAYADELVSTARRGGAPIREGKAYSTIPIEGGTVVAVGVRGCRAVLISAGDPAAVPVLADAVFRGRT
jgi:hypothetical protein